MTDRDETVIQLGEIGLDNFAPYLMNRIMGRFNTALSSDMSDLGLTVPKMRTLAVLSVRDGITIRELAVYAVVEHSTMSRTLDGLEEEGLIRRARDPQDNRAVLIHLTAEGRVVFHRVWPSMVKACDRLLGGIEDDEIRAFVGTLQKILRNVRHHDF